MNTTLSNKHKFFIQFMLKNGLVTQNNAMTFFEEISQENHSPAHLKSLIAEINKEIGNHFFKIASTTCEITGEKVFVWLNTRNDELSRLQTGFSAVELEYFHAVMQEILTAEDHRIMYPHAINISSTLSSALSRENGEKALIKWIKGGYYVKKDTHIYLGPRTILEFTTYLRTSIDNCSCDLCSDLVFVGQSCYSCDKTFHSFCLEKYLQNNHSCPSCKNQWRSDDTDDSMETSR